MFSMQYFVYMAFFPFLNHTLKLKVPDQPQSAHIYTVTCATLCVSFFIKIEGN